MSDHQNEKALRIAAYIENRLSPEEREAFKRSLSEDDELRVQYVDALMNRAGTAPGARKTGEGGTRPEDDAGAELRSGSTGETVAHVGLEENARDAIVGEGGELSEGREARRTDEAESMDGAMETGTDKNSWEIANEEEARRTVGEDWAGGTMSEESHAESGGGERAVESVNEEGPGESMKVEGAAETGDEQWVGEASEARRSREGRKAGGRFFGSGWMVGVTILLLIIAGVVIFLLTRHQEFWDKTVAAIATDSGDANKRTRIDPVAKDTVNTQVTGSGGGTDSTKAGAGIAAASGNGGFGDSLYAKLYRPYMRGDDPVEVRVYYQDYKTGNYAAVLAGDESKVAAAGARRLQLKNYLRLYKGLAYLATGNARDAVTELGEVTFRTNPGDELYETARWYLALAWLKRNDADPAEVRSKVLGIVRDISHGYSRYREPAREIVRALGS